MSATRKTWTVTRCDSFEDMRRAGIRNWQRRSAAAPQRRSAAERRQAAWELVVEAWQMQKRDPNELRLQKPAQVLRKA
jgi:hypothetical protein